MSFFSTGARPKSRLREGPLDRMDIRKSNNRPMCVWYFFSWDGAKIRGATVVVRAVWWNLAPPTWQHIGTLCQKVRSSRFSCEARIGGCFLMSGSVYYPPVAWGTTTHPFITPHERYILILSTYAFQSWWFFIFSTALVFDRVFTVIQKYLRENGVEKIFCAWFL